jgi:integrin alpha FG-GAP repeat containing protein 1
VLDTTYQPPLPLPIRLGDADLDGFPDMFFIGVSSTGERTPQLLFSIPAIGQLGQRTWHLPTTGTESLTNIKDARGLVFIDLDEDVSDYLFMIIMFCMTTFH